MSTSIPQSILIIGSGVFGLSTAYALAKRPEYKSCKITVVDKSTFPTPDAGSVDTSRLVRAEYTDYAYAAFAAEAQEVWRGEFGADGRYNESGYIVLMDDASSPEAQAVIAHVLENTKKRGLKIGESGDDAQMQMLRDVEAVKAATPGFSGAGGVVGFANRTSGWAHAENGLRHMRKLVEDTGRVEFRVATVKHLLFEQKGTEEHVAGALLTDGSSIRADLTIVAAGAWSGSLVDLRGIATATGHVLAYVSITDEEQDRLLKNPAILNANNFMYIIPPRDNVLKIARHGYGYANPVEIYHPERNTGEQINVSLPWTKNDDPDLQVPLEGREACRSYMAQCLPEFADRPWLHTRICWYSDTIKEDWLVDYHPKYKGLFLATGDSGHGYKFLPIIGERIADVLTNSPKDDLGRTLLEKWKWPKQPSEHFLWTEEWRGGREGMILRDELISRRPSTIDLSLISQQS